MSGGILPGGTVGILGGGQLARMMALEARRMGYRVAVLDPDAHGSAAQVADHHVQGRLDDAERARVLAQMSDVVTLDTEHVPAELLAGLEQYTLVRPGPHVLRVVQDRLRQRRFLEEHGLPQPRYASIARREDLAEAARSVGFPAVLKTRRDGYDGKGQARVQSLAELEAAWDGLGRRPTTLEAFVRFDREISVVLARGAEGEIRFYAAAENRHRHHVLHTSHVPAALAPDVRTRAETIGARVATALGHVGMLAVELFSAHDGELLVNEIAPRTHNSGHATFGACATSQFEQHVRAICGLPLGDTTQLRPAVMLNLLGDLWRDGEPRWEAVLAHPGARLHLYGKGRASKGRKMGHVLVLEETLERASAVADQIARALEPRSRTGMHEDGAHADEHAAPARPAAPVSSTPAG